MASYCVKVLENEVGKGNPVRAGAGSLSGGKRFEDISAADLEAVRHLTVGENADEQINPLEPEATFDVAPELGAHLAAGQHKQHHGRGRNGIEADEERRGGAGGRSEGDSAGGVEPGDQGGGADCGGRVGLGNAAAAPGRGDGQGDSEAGEAAPQAVTQAEYDGPKDVKAWQERDRQAAEMLAPAPQVDPVVFETLEAMRVAGEKAFGAALENIERLRDEDSHARSVAAHSHMMEQVVLTIDRELRKDAGLPPYDPNEASAAAVITGKDKSWVGGSRDIDPFNVLSSSDPTPRVVDTAKEAAETALRMKKPPAAKKENRKCKFCGAKMERWSATTLRCTACTRNEAL